MKRTKNSRKIKAPAIPVAEPVAVTPAEPVANIVHDLIEMARTLPGEQLSQLVSERQAELRSLEILNIQRNVQSCRFDKPELDGFLSTFLQVAKERRLQLTVQIQQAAVNAGLPQNALENFAQKLARLGLHI